MKISSLNFKNNLRGSAVLSLIHGKEMILKNEVKDFLTKDFADQGYDETIIFEANESDGLLSACLLYTSPSPRDLYRSRMPSSA